MSDSTDLSRSPELMSRDDTALLVVDVQEKLLPAINEGGRVAWNVRRLIDGAKILGIPVFATEQYPNGLGPTIDGLRDRLGDVPDKLGFSCRSCDGLFAELQRIARFKVLVVGIETHVCVQQTVLDLLAAGFRACIAVDAVGSRFPVDRDIAIRRMDSSGATVTTTEAALFEWCETAEIPEFKVISTLVREPESH